jgi:hypothetical protein
LRWTRRWRGISSRCIFHRSLWHLIFLNCNCKLFLGALLRVFFSRERNHCRFTFLFLNTWIMSKWWLWWFSYGFIKLLSSQQHKWMMNQSTAIQLNYQHSLGFIVLMSRLCCQKVKKSWCPHSLYRLLGKKPIYRVDLLSHLLIFAFFSLVPLF